MSRPTGYVIDTNVLIDGKRHYPSDVFPHFWHSIEALVTDGRLVCPEDVLVELEDGSDDLPKWVKSVPKILASPSDVTIAIVDEITATHVNWVSNSDHWADPWVIAEAKCRGWAVVTQEKGKMLEVCRQHLVEVMDILGMIRREGWRF